MLRSLLESCLPAPLTPVEVVPLVKQLENEISKSGSPFLRYEDICNIYKVTEKLFTWRMIGDTGTGKSTLIRALIQYAVGNVSDNNFETKCTLCYHCVNSDVVGWFVRKGGERDWHRKNNVKDVNNWIDQMNSRAHDVSKVYEVKLTGPEQLPAIITDTPGTEGTENSVDIASNSRKFVRQKYALSIMVVKVDDNLGNTLATGQVFDEERIQPDIIVVTKISMIHGLTKDILRKKLDHWKRKYQDAKVQFVDILPSDENDKYSHTSIMRYEEEKYSEFLGDNSLNPHFGIKSFYLAAINLRNKKIHECVNYNLMREDVNHMLAFFNPELPTFMEPTEQNIADVEVTDKPSDSGGYGVNFINDIALLSEIVLLDGMQEAVRDEESLYDPRVIRRIITGGGGSGGEHLLNDKAEYRKGRQEKLLKNQFVKQLDILTDSLVHQLYDDLFYSDRSVLSKLYSELRKTEKMESHLKSRLQDTHRKIHTWLTIENSEIKLSSEIENENSASKIIQQARQEHLNEAVYALKGVMDSLPSFGIEYRKRMRIVFEDIICKSLKLEVLKNEVFSFVSLDEYKKFEKELIDELNFLVKKTAREYVRLFKELATELPSLEFPDVNELEDAITNGNHLIKIRNFNEIHALLKIIERVNEESIDFIRVNDKFKNLERVKDTETTAALLKDLERDKVWDKHLDKFWKNLKHECPVKACDYIVKSRDKMNVPMEGDRLYLMQNLKIRKRRHDLLERLLLQETPAVEPQPSGVMSCESLEHSDYQDDYEDSDVLHVLRESAEPLHIGGQWQNVTKEEYDEIKLSKKEIEYLKTKSEQARKKIAVAKLNGIRDRTDPVVRDQLNSLSGPKHFHP